MKILIKTDMFIPRDDAKEIADRIKRDLESGFVQVPPYIKVMIITDEGKVFTI